MPVWWSSVREVWDGWGQGTALGYSTVCQGFVFVPLKLWDLSKAGNRMGPVVGVTVLFAF